MQTLFTTGQVSKLCQVAPRTVSKWFDAGRFDGGWRIPGSLDPRIPRYSLVAFLARNGLPTIEELENLQATGDR